MTQHISFADRPALETKYDPKTGRNSMKRILVLCGKKVAVKNALSFKAELAKIPADRSGLCPACVERRKVWAA
jgi:hypothetical protein